MTYLTEETMEEMSEVLELSSDSQDSSEGTPSPSDQIWAVNTDLVTRHYPLPCRECGTALSRVTQMSFDLTFDFSRGDVTVLGQGNCDDCGESSGRVEVPALYLVSSLTLSINSLDSSPF